MGDSQHPLGARMGRTLFIWGQGQEFGNMLRGWVAPASMATGVAKYLGLSTESSIAVGVGLIVVIVILTFVGGYYHVRLGGANAAAALSNAQDPWRCRVLEILEKLEPRL